VPSKRSLSTQGPRSPHRSPASSFRLHSRSSHWFRVHFSIVSTPLPLSAALASGQANLHRSTLRVAAAAPSASLPEPFRRQGTALSPPSYTFAPPSRAYSARRSSQHLPGRCSHAPPAPRCSSITRCPRALQPPRHCARFCSDSTRSRHRPEHSTAAPFARRSTLVSSVALAAP